MEERLTRGFISMTMTRPQQVGLTCKLNVRTTAGNTYLRIANGAVAEVLELFIGKRPSWCNGDELRGDPLTEVPMEQTTLLVAKQCMTSISILSSPRWTYQHLVPGEQEASVPTISTSSPSMSMPPPATK